MLHRHTTHWVQGQWRNKFLDAVRGIENARVQKVHLETVSCSTKMKCNSCVHVVQGTDVQTAGTMHSKLCTAVQLAAVWSVSTSAPFRDVWHTVIQCCTTSQKSEDLNGVIVLGALASVGHGGAVHIHPVWACVMSMLIVIGEQIQCCPLLTNCRVQKRGDNCLRKSRGAVCGNTPYWTTQTSNPSW